MLNRPLYNYPPPAQQRFMVSDCLPMRTAMAPLHPSVYRPFPLVSIDSDQQGNGGWKASHLLFGAADNNDRATTQAKMTAIATSTLCHTAPPSSDSGAEYSLDAVSSPMRNGGTHFSEAAASPTEAYGRAKKARAIRYSLFDMAEQYPIQQPRAQQRKAPSGGTLSSDIGSSEEAKDDSVGAESVRSGDSSSSITVNELVRTAFFSLHTGNTTDRNTIDRLVRMRPHTAGFRKWDNLAGGSADRFPFLSFRKMQILRGRGPYMS